MKRKPRSLLVALTMILALVVGMSAAAPAFAASQPKLNVFAAASLSHAFPAMVKPFKAKYPKYQNLKFVFNFQGTDTLVSQIELGAPADVFAGASTKYGTQLYKEKLVATPNLFCQNKLCVIVPSANTAGIANLGDLTKTGVLIAIGDAAVPIGTYTRTVLTNIGKAGTYGTDYSDKVMSNVSATCANVTQVVSLVVMGEVDAGFVYRSDPKYAGSKVTQVSIPNAYQSSPLPTYPIARVKTAAKPLAAKQFIQFVMSARGQKILRTWGFLPKPALLVSAVLPSTGALGSTVTITGEGFGKTPGTVSIGGTAATVTTWGSRCITATVPATLAGGAQSITVTTAGGKTSNAVTFTVVVPD